MNTNKVYLDYAASTPLDEAVFAEMTPYFKDKFYNPSSLYLDSIKVKQELSDYRSRVARVIGAKVDEVVFTAGATESINLAISGIAEAYPGTKIITSAIEHKAVIDTAKQYDHATVNVDNKGNLDLNHLKTQIDDNIILVSIIYANNEIATVQNLAEIAQVISDIRQDRRLRGVDLPIYLHSDASQSANYLDLHVSRLGVDLMTLSGAKTYGPKMSGILYIKSGVSLKPIIHGGGQEYGLRSGTESLALVAGLTKALEIAQEGRKEESKRLRDLQKYLETQLSDLSTNIDIHSLAKNKLPNIVNFSIKGVDAERLVMMLDEHGVQVATGSACSASSDEPSHVLRAIGLSESLCNSSIRISMGRQTSKEDIDLFNEALKKCLNDLAKL